jgi:hypothetical protein
MSQEREMTERERSNAVLERKRADGAPAEGDGAAVENDFWVWGVIFTTTALTALCLAMLFCVGTG